MNEGPTPMNDTTEPTTSGEATRTEEQAGVSTKDTRCLRVVRLMEEDGLGHMQNI